MCRTAGRRCIVCNDPQTRRNRQNLAYAVKKEQEALANAVPPIVEKKTPTTLAEAVAAEVTFDGLEESEIANQIELMLADPDISRKVAAEIRSDREKAESNRAWLLNGAEDTPENLAAGVAERQDQIIMVGIVVGERAQAIHGIDIDEARAQWSQRLQDAQENYSGLRKEADGATEEYSRRRKEMTEQKDVLYYELHNHLSDEEKSELAVLDKLRKDANKKSMEAHVKVQEILTGRDEETLAVLDKISEGNRQAISEVRPVGNAKVDFRNGIRGGAESGESFTSVISETFPDEWVNKSNELGNLALKRVSKASGRAHYMSVRENAPAFRYSMDKKPDPNDDRYSDWTEKVDENGNPTGTWHGLKRDFMEPVSIRNYKKYDGEKPKGAGWKPGQAVGRNGQVVYGWVRDNATDLKYQKSLSAPEAEITVYVGEGNRETRRVITHEFSHRIEDANPHIKTLEEGFLASRTTLENGKREPLMSYRNGQIQGRAYGNNREVVREDNFTTPYIGREYPDGSREVLSVGSESVFTGSQGGLVGIGNAKSDLQMRNWILGVYATM